MFSNMWAVHQCISTNLVAYPSSTYKLLITNLHSNPYPNESNKEFSELLYNNDI